MLCSMLPLICGMSSASTPSTYTTDVDACTHILSLFLCLLKQRLPTHDISTFECHNVWKRKKERWNGGQTIFKIAIKYGFNSLYFDEIGLGILEDYVEYVRPLLHPQCDYIILNRNSMQFQKLTDLLSVLVFQANRQIHSLNKIYAHHRDRECQQVGIGGTEIYIRRPEA